MTVIASAIFYALFVWWFSTGLVLMLVLRRGSARASIPSAMVLFPLCLVVLAYAARHASLVNVYVAFTAAIALWGTQETLFLTGTLTGPRPSPCPTGAKGFDRFCYAICAILYHEIALVVSGAAVVVSSMGQPNQTGVATFLVLWLMRLSAKLSLFLGVPVVHDEVLPTPIAFIRSYFRRGPTNIFLPVAMLVSGLATWALVDAALAAHGDPASTAKNILVATLLALAVLEHVFMVVPLPIDRLWKWSVRRAPSGSTAEATGERSPPTLERVTGPLMS